MPKLLTEEEYHRVITYKTQLSMTNIAIAEELDIRRQTVAAIMKRYTQTGSPLPNIKGHKKKTNISTSAVEDEAIEDLSRTNPFKTPRVIKRELNLHCSLATIKRRLRKVHLNGRRPACKSFLTPYSLLWTVCVPMTLLNIDCLPAFDSPVQYLRLPSSLISPISLENI